MSLCFNIRPRRLTIHIFDGIFDVTVYIIISGGEDNFFWYHISRFLLVDRNNSAGVSMIEHYFAHNMYCFNNLPKIMIDSRESVDSTASSPIFFCIYIIQITHIEHKGFKNYLKIISNHHCTARQCSPLRRKFMECAIINPALSLLMKSAPKSS